MRAALSITRSWSALVARGLLGETLASITTVARPTPELPPFAYTPPPYTGPSKTEVLKLRTEFMNPAIFHFYKDPVMITAGKQQYLYDESGRRYLDCFAGIVTVSCGHCHPTVDAAVARQMERLQHTTTIYLNDQVASYAKELSER